METETAQMKPSFAQCVMLQDALVTTRILCAPTNLTVSVRLRVPTCCQLSVATVVGLATHQVTAMLPGLLQLLLLLLLLLILLLWPVFVCPPFPPPHTLPHTQNNHPALYSLDLKKNKKKEISLNLFPTENHNRRRRRCPPYPSHLFRCVKTTNHF